MKFQVYFLLGTSLSCFPALALGQCVVTEDCTALGYTESSCPGKGLKCPFGNGWFCSGDEASICAENGFKYNCSGTGYAGGAGAACGGKYTQCSCASGYEWKNGSCALSCSSSYQYSCTGTGYAGGAGSACGGKYTQCTCASGYEWKNGSCQKQAQNGPVGDLYYCNGAVVAVKAPGMNFYVAMKDLGQMYWDDARDNCAAYSFCGNLKGTLPSRDQLQAMYKNKSSLESLLTAHGGKKFSTDDRYWSSTYERYNNSDHYYLVDMSNGHLAYAYGVSTNNYARPVLASY